MAQKIDLEGLPDQEVDTENLPYVDLDGLPDTEPIQTEPEEGILSKAFSPIVETPGNVLRDVASSIDEPSLTRSPWEARVRGFLAGALGGMPGETEAPIVGRGGLAGEVDLAVSPVGIAGMVAKPLARVGKGLVSGLRGRNLFSKSVKAVDDVPTSKAVDVAEVTQPELFNARQITKYEKAIELLNLPRALKSGPDISIPLRQGLTSIHSKNWWKAWGALKAGIKSEDAYDVVMGGVQSHPRYKEARAAGVQFTDLKGLRTREENFASRYAEAMPVIGGLYRRSNRAATAFINDLRMKEFGTLFDDAINISDGMYASAKGNLKLIKEAERADPRKSTILVDKLAKYINNTTGRGSLGDFEKVASELNTIFYSPRLTASRLQFFNPRNYTNADPFIRKQYLKSMASLTGFWMTIAGAAKASGLADVNLDTTSSDFGKIRIGDTRIDVAGGFQQFLVLFSRIMAQGSTSSTTGEFSNFGEGFRPDTMGSVAMRTLITNKLQPVAGLIHDAAMATEYRPFNPADQTLQLFTPMVIDDLTEIAMENPELLGITVPAGIVGLGTNTYSRGDIGKPTYPMFEDFPQWTGSFER